MLMEIFFVPMFQCRLLDDSHMMSMCVYTGFCALGHVGAHKHYVFIYDINV